MKATNEKIDTFTDEFRAFREEQRKQNANTQALFRQIATRVGAVEGRVGAIEARLEAVEQYSISDTGDYGLDQDD